MKTFDYLKVDWPTSTEQKKITIQDKAKLIERQDGWRSFVLPTTELIPRNQNPVMTG